MRHVSTVKINDTRRYSHWQNIINTLHFCPKCEFMCMKEAKERHS